MRNIVAICASPRTNGNSNAICDSILDGTMGMSTNTIHKYNINKLNSIHGCQNCNRCKLYGRCVLMDDISDVLDKIREADSVIVTVPMYFHHASAQYRTLEDRFYSYFDSNLRCDIGKGKRVAFAVTYDYDDDDAMVLLDSIKRVFESMGFEVVDSILYRCEGRVDAASKDPEIISLAKSVGYKLRDTESEI